LIALAFLLYLSIHAWQIQALPEWLLGTFSSSAGGILATVHQQEVGELTSQLFDVWHKGQIVSSIVIVIIVYFKSR